MGKITVKHYLNTNLKPYMVDGEKLYKVYVLIRADTQNTKIKSDVSNREYSENEYNQLIENKTSELSLAIIEETKIIEFIVNKIGEDGKVFTSSLFTDYATRLKRKLGEFIKANNDYYDPLFSPNRDRFLYVPIHQNGKLIDISKLTSLLSKNYEIEDIYIVQWFTTNAREELYNLYRERCKQLERSKQDTEIIKEFEHLDKELKIYLNKSNSY